MGIPLGRKKIPPPREKKSPGRGKGGPKDQKKGALRRRSPEGRGKGAGGGEKSPPGEGKAPGGPGGGVFFLFSPQDGGGGRGVTLGLQTTGNRDWPLGGGRRAPLPLDPCGKGPGGGGTGRARRGGVGWGAGGVELKSPDQVYARSGQGRSRPVNQVKQTRSANGRGE